MDGLISEHDDEFQNTRFLNATIQSPFVGILGNCYAALEHETNFDIEWLIKEAATSRGRFLDLLCGSGRLGSALAAAGGNVVAVDQSESMLSQARLRLHPPTLDVMSRIRFERGDALTLDMGMTFDGVCLGGLRYASFGPDERQQLLRAFRRHLRPGGKVHFNYSSLLRHEEETSDQFGMPIKLGEAKGFYYVEWRRRPEIRRSTVRMLCELVTRTGETQRYVGGVNFCLFDDEEVKENLRKEGFKVTGMNSVKGPPGSPTVTWVTGQIAS